ncbi:MAG: hypothetical protein NWF00_09655 [Candidatus Bathyarchaeota archaeon]|nr:hypothetical protein [Candidatus Bathyarchaeota archaeon]
MSRWRVFGAVLIIIVSSSVLGPYYLSYLDTKTSVDLRYTELTQTPEPYSFTMPLRLRFNGSSPVGLENESGLAFRLTFTCPNETLVVNEPVTIDSVTVLDYAWTAFQEVDIIFQNSLAYPLCYEDNGVIPKAGTLSFYNPIGGDTVNAAAHNNVFRNITINCDTQVVWQVEGNYSPLIVVFFNDGTNKTYTTDDVIIHVYPRAQLAQIESERVSLSATQANLKLSEAVFILGIVSIVALVIQVLDVPTQMKCKYAEKTAYPQQAQTNTKQPIANKPWVSKKSTSRLTIHKKSPVTNTIRRIPVVRTIR